MTDDPLSADPDEPARFSHSGAPATPGVDRRTRACAVLGVARDADRDEIRASYLALCRRYHPDRFANDPARCERANELVREITLAYRTLEEATSPRSKT